MLSCKGEDCNKYVDRMSKSIDDQGFLNVYYANVWRAISHYYNMKVMFYVKGRVWGENKASIRSESVVALHWIGPSKPWNPDILFPCGNTKKYCFCSHRESKALEYVRNRWEDDLNSILILRNNSFRAIINDARRIQLLRELKIRHARAKARICKP